MDRRKSCIVLIFYGSNVTMSGIEQIDVIKYHTLRCSSDKTMYVEVVDNDMNKTVASFLEEHHVKDQTIFMVGDVGKDIKIDDINIHDLCMRNGCYVSVKYVEVR